MPRRVARERGQVIRKGDQKYLIRIYLGRDPKGVRKYASETINGTKKEAEKKLTDLLSKSDTQQYSGPTHTTLGAYLDTWLEGKTDLSAVTLEGYKGRIETDIKPTIGGLKLEKLTAQTIQAVFNKLNEKGLSPRTIQYSRMILKQALERAVEWGLIHRNPAKRITIPKQVKREMQTLTPLQAEQLITWANDNQEEFVALWVLLLTTGLRPQEALALKWDDLTEAVDESGDPYPIFIVRRVLTKDEEGHYTIGPTKTDKSTRQVSLDEDTLRFLREHKARQNVVALAGGENYQRQGWVFANHRGHTWDISKVRKRWKTALTGAKLPEMRLYDGRHTHATLLLSKGVHPKVVADRLGHSTTNLTMNTYSHVIKGVAKDAGKVAAGAIFGAGEKKTAER